MPAWAWVLTVLFTFAGLLALLLAAARLRYRFEAEGMWTGRVDASRGSMAARVEFRFPGVKRAWELPPREAAENREDARPSAQPEPAPPEHARPTPPPPPAGRPRGATPETSHERPRAETPEATASEQPAPETERQTPGSSPPAELSRRERRMRMLFLLATDSDVWAWTRDYGVRAAVLTFRLLDPRVAAAIGHPDPAFLGRTAGKWYAIRPLLKTRRAALGFRFQDRHPSFKIRLDGGFSALTLAMFGVRLVLAFPAVRLGRRAWRHWRRPRLAGWRAKVYTHLRERP